MKKIILFFLLALVPTVFGFAQASSQYIPAKDTRLKSLTRDGNNLRANIMNVANGNIVGTEIGVGVFSGLSDNIYNIDGTLTNGRTINAAGNYFQVQNASSISFNSTGSTSIGSNGTMNVSANYLYSQANQDAFYSANDRLRLQANNKITVSCFNEIEQISQRIKNVGTTYQKYRRITATTSLYLGIDHIVSVGNGGNNIIVSLPDPATVYDAANSVGAEFIIKRYPGTTGSITINVNGGANLEERNSATFVNFVNLYDEPLRYISNGTAYERY